MRYIYLLRHGNPGREEDPRRCLGSIDVSLSAFGRKQMEMAGPYIRSFLWEKVYSSPMRRCMETAECLGIKKEEMILKDNLREMAAGIWENMTFARIKEKYADLYEMRGRQLGTFAVEGAESFEEAAYRFQKCIDEIRKETEANILVIAHAGVIRSYLCLLSGKDMDRVMDFSIPYGSLSILEESNGCLDVAEWGIRAEDLLDEAEIQRIYEKCKTPENVITHMRKVGETAMQIMDNMEERESFSLIGKKRFSREDRQLVYKASLLHDIRRTEKNHPEKGAEFLRKEGYKRVAELVALHHSTYMDSDAEIGLHEILFYADKLVRGEHLVSLKERFEHSFEKCRGNVEAEEKHRKLYEKAKRIEAMIGQ